MAIHTDIFEGRTAGRSSLKGIKDEPFHIVKVVGNKTLCGRDASDWLRLDHWGLTDDPREMAAHRDCCRQCRAKA